MIKRPPIPADSYTITANDWIRDPRLSWKAKGLLVYIGSHAAGHTLSTDQILADGTDGKDAVRAGLLELEAAGYLVRSTHRGRDGKITGTDYELTDPEPGRETRTGSDQEEQDVSAGRDQCGKPVAGKPAGKKTSSKKTKEEDLSDAGASADQPKVDSAQTIIGDYIDWLATQTPPVKLTRDVIARYGASIKQRLEESHDVTTIKRALARMHERGKAGSPALLSSFVVEVQNRPTSGAPSGAGQYQTAAEKNAEATRYRMARAEIADRLMADGMDFERAMTEAESRLASSKDQSVDTGSATRYIDGEVVQPQEVTAS